MTNTKLTVVLPVYNGQDLLKETIENILAFPIQDMELLLIDDGSTDGSGGVCRAYAEADSRVHCHFQAHEGIVSARNRGLLLAAGKYVCFFDQDDIAQGNVYVGLLERMEEAGAQIGMCSTGRLMRGAASPYEVLKDAVYDEEQILKELLCPLLFRGYSYPYVEKGNYLYGTVWKCIFRMDFIRKHDLHFRSFIDYEDDWIFVTQVLSMSKCAVTVGRTGYFWRVSEHSYSHAGQYVEGLPDKLADYDGYCLPYLSKRLSEGMMAQYSQINFCEHFMVVYDNALRASGSGRKAARREAARYLREHDYRAQLVCRKYLDKSVFRRRWLYACMARLPLGFSFFLNRLLLFAGSVGERSQAIVALERRRKIF